MFWPLFLFFLGVTLIVLEFVLPGIVCGVGGAVLLCISAVLGIAAYPEYTFMIVMGEFMGLALGVGLGLIILSKTSSATGLALGTSLSEESGYVNLPSNTALVGRPGLVMTALRPSGTIIVDGERHDAVSDGDFILEGEAVRVLEVHGNRVVVERVEANA
jgi:membrane-bound serine protease (ClpP class)